MREEILAALIGGDEAEAFTFVERLDGTCTHVCYSSKKMNKGSCPSARPSTERNNDLRRTAKNDRISDSAV
jgi:hypothetical protein